MRAGLGRVWSRLGSRRARAVALGLVAVLVVSLGAGVAALASAQPAVRVENLRVPVGAEANGAAVTLDASIFRPPSGAGPWPAVVLAHGFGGSKASMAADAEWLARRGYLVLTYTARGFGRSGGLIHLDAPGYEVADAEAMVSLLGRRSDVISDGPDDPRVGFAGGSYGGALSLLVAGYDHRVDAIVPSITWNNLAQALIPQYAESASATGPGTPAAVHPIDTAGVFKRMWAGLLFGEGAAPTATGTASSSAAGGSAGTASASPAGSAAGPALVCGRFAPDICQAYTELATTGRPSSATLALLAASSPASVTAQIKAPTLLVQGEADSLFPLSQADANARQIAAAGTPVSVLWIAGGHDTGVTDTAELRTLTLDWFNHYLLRDSTPAVTGFRVSVPDAAASATDSGTQAQTRLAAGYPGIAGSPPAAHRTVPLRGSSQPIVAPPGGQPAAVTSLPGLGGVSSLASAAAGLSVLPGQSAVFGSTPLTGPFTLVGAPTVKLTITSSGSTATLFAGLYDVGPGGSRPTLPEGLVSPVQLRGLTPGQPSTVTVVLPAIVHNFPAGHSMRLVVSSTNQAFAMPAAPAVYSVGLASAGLSLPVVATTAVSGGATVPPALLAGVLVLLAVIAVAGLLARRRSREHGSLADLVGVPLDVQGLSKTYGDGFRAVDEISFRVERGQVVGLLGPNGAGKTTTLRMLMGLVRPTAGQIRVFGEQVRPGAAVLERVGAFVEGPGFLPHLSGVENLRLYWAATGRPVEESRLELALEISGLAAAAERKVRTYSHGMRQRLGIAQAMLGLPDLLVLDEPTNGLDPPQIREMREVLRRYAEAGRTVVVSSHLLAEVEQTCSHVVVMSAGRLVAAGPVAEMVAAAGPVVVDVDDPERARAALAGLAGVEVVADRPGALVLDLDGLARAEVIRRLVEAGIGVAGLAGQRRLEEVFLALVGEERS